MQDVKEYWDTRAREYATAPAATTNDVHLRELEIASLVTELRRLGVGPRSRVLDVGCGNGYSTLRVAEALPGVRFAGVDFSEQMIESANRLLASRPDLADRVSFSVGDATDLSGAPKDVDAVITDRCLINLETLERQALAIRRIAERLRPGGHYVAIENFVEGHDEMNRLREAVGLAAIPVRWHNRFFTEQEFCRAAGPWFEAPRFWEFSSSYYFATRVIYAAMCRMRGEEPDYDHEIHRLAVRIPPAGAMSPIRMATLTRRTAP